MTVTVTSSFAIKSYQKPLGYFSAIDSFKIFLFNGQTYTCCYASQIWGYEYVDRIGS